MMDALPPGAENLVSIRRPYMSRGITVPVHAPAPARFAVTDLDDIELGEEPQWLLEGLLPATGFGCVFGPPKSFKSFLLASALFHIAMGRAWAGRRVLLPGAVIYIVAEGIEGFKRRLIAMRRHFEVEGQKVPFGIITLAPDLGHTPGDAEELKNQVRAWLQEKGNPPVRAIAIDTVARTLKGADESSAKDMGAFADNCTELGQVFDCIAIAVHHSGKDVSRGARGSNSLDGAVDVMWSVERDQSGMTGTARVLYMKDGEDGLSWRFRADPFVLREATETGPEVSTLIIETTSEPSHSKPSETSRRSKLPDKAQRLLDIITEAVSEAGKHVSGDPVVPHDAAAITRDVLRRYATTRGYTDPDQQKPNSARAQINNNLNTLAARKRIGLTKEHVWLPGGAK
jgi:hypothetical protein